MDPQQKAAEEAAAFVEILNATILFPLIALLSGIAFLVFLWGAAEYIFGANNDQARNQGRSHMLFGIIGLVVMVSAWALLTLATNTFGLGDQLDCADDPGACAGDEFKLPEV